MSIYVEYVKKNISKKRLCSVSLAFRNFHVVRDINTPTEYDVRTVIAKLAMKLWR